MKIDRGMNGAAQREESFTTCFGPQYLSVESNRWCSTHTHTHTLAYSHTLTHTHLLPSCKLVAHGEDCYYHGNH